MSDKGKTGSLLGKILLPGYTDAGPDSSFKPVQVASMVTVSHRPADDDDMMSEAATEIFDNRSYPHKQRLPQAPRREPPKETQHQKQQPDIPKPSPRKSGENTYAFFPSTKPMPSPRPVSPPRVTRRQVSTSSVAATSTVPETGAFSGEELERLERIQNSRDEESDGDGGQVMKLSAKALQAMDENQATSSSEDASGRAKQRTSLIENDDASSYVSSTASEMGTVINIGSDRFAEIEAMAAMVEANADFFEMQEKEMQQEYMRRPGEKEILSLPILEGRSFEEPAVLPSKSRTPDSERGQDLGLRMKTTAEANDDTTTTPSINHQQHSNNPTTSAMVSAAIRRIGTGMSNKSMSAPNTPKTHGMLPRVEDLLKSTLTPGRNVKETSSKQGSTLQSVLRSPGGNSMVADKTVLTPRFSRTPRSEHDSHLRQGQRPPISPSIMLPGLQFAKKCFSYDNTYDEYPFPVAEEGEDTFGMDVPRSRGDRYSLRYRPLQQSQSWDVGHGKHQDAAFRARHHAFGTFQRTASYDHHSELRQRLDSDNFSPSKFSRTPAIELQTSQRIETEREDALDILACLVERGIEQGPEGDNSSSSDQDTALAKLSEDLKNISKGGSKESEEMKNDEESKSEEATERVDEQIGVQADLLELLLKSHSYASEMRQATKSASSWLHSIGRGMRKSSSTVDLERKKVDEQLNSGEEKSEEHKSNADEGSLRLQLSTLKAMLHSTQAELREKSEANEKLDAELSKCRAEIGRLRSASRSEPLHLTANKSILDVSGNNTPSVSPEKKEKPEATLDKLEESKILDDSFNPDNSVMHGTLLQGKGLNESVIEIDQLNSTAMREALNRANETIRRLHRELKDGKKIDDENEPPVVPFPDNALSNVLSPLPEEKKSASDSMSADLQTINVRMLDGENFVTEWTDLTPPLPPPPDHGLRSPIVSVVLEQWTTDRGLHESLLSWIDRVMTGIDLESSVPPLTISSLDHQVRDGFVMHVLPLLLRRADIHVDVQTRAHRRTSYDISVTVTQKTAEDQVGFGYSKPTQALLDQQHHVDEWAENFDPQIDTKSVAHSAVTEHMSNSNSKLYYTGSYKASHPPIGEYSSFAEMVPPSESHDMDQSAKTEPGIMSALGGALGGFLSRRKGTNSPPREEVAAIQRAASFEEAEEPYHRVVSAPPGRIGVTFVEYRGHAMVSDVSPDSPLSSWIYPSDILIAIDDTPVSGMRVRDIVKVLTNRRDQQRALRVISSHAMNEFTLNQSAMVNEPT